ncbi:uncharacterized protein RSE6_14643 [Rhynchosporium secalis]|uniref:Uncharacterized protein n=1 Tax=Rhynchosporium secalis TaxID=38038 RepID=A0A1E1MVV3_RHYSE|nr:uncharacterized protein RSE6_14643 [Rhynchosporium secalis]
MIVGDGLYPVTIAPAYSLRTQVYYDAFDTESPIFQGYSA